ncbi:uncharacterized protein V6R79_005185 [Siganus canaliculatus]
MIQLKDIIDSKGDIDINIVYKKLQVHGMKAKKQEVARVVNDIQENMPKEWKQLLKAKATMGLTNEEYEFIDIDNKQISNLSTKYFYRLMIRRKIRTPTAVKHWTTTFSPVLAQRIWTNILDIATPHHLFSLDFKIKHRKIFTGIMLHQINREHGRGCTRCGQLEEDLEHIFLDCAVCHQVWEKIDKLLEKRCGFKMEVQMKRYIHLFGLMDNEKRRSINRRLINWILSFTRHAMYVSRNISRFERRTSNIWTLFENSFTHHVNILFQQQREWAMDTLAKNNTVLNLMENDVLEIVLS